MKRKETTKSWAREVVATMSPEAVRHWLKRLGVKVPADTRTPIERALAGNGGEG